MAGEGRTQAQCREALPEIVLAADPPRPVGELSSLRSLIDGAVLDLMRAPLWVAGSKMGIDHS
jgi:hypothetical protein